MAVHTGSLSQPRADLLDAEIERVRSEIKSLSYQRTILTSSLLTPGSTQSLLSRARDPFTRHLLSSLSTRLARKQLQSTYRLCAGASLFETRDSDPKALDGGRLIGVRVESFDRRSRKFAVPVYLFLQRVGTHEDAEEEEAERELRLRVHRHTVPSYIPLQSLLAKYLPPPPSDPEKPRWRQDLGRLVHELRRVLVSWQRRKEAVAALDLKRWAGVERVATVDAEHMDLRVMWGDGDVGRIIVNMQGKVERVIIIDQNGARNGKAERRLMAAGRLDELTDALGAWLPSDRCKHC